MRIDGRANNELRPVKITADFIKYAEGSVLLEMGDTKVICTASIENKVPPFLKDSGQGWVTAEYGMLPRATATRNQREAAKGQGGRTHEIQRLIGRSLRTVVNMQALGERTVYMDCDVIQADGGTRTAAITGSFIALAQALQKLKKQEKIQVPLIKNMVAAISVGFVEGTALLDLNYSEDSSAQTDMNIIMTDAEQIIEIQGTAERNPFSCSQLTQLLDLSKTGIGKLIAVQREILGFPVPF